MSPTMIDGITTLINGIVSATMISGVEIVTMISGVEIVTMINGVEIATMISGIFIRKIVGGPVRDTSILEVVVVLHEVASVYLVIEDRIDLSMRW